MYGGRLPIRRCGGPHLPRGAEYPSCEMSLALIIVVIAITALTAVAVIGLFLWGAVKDGQDNDAIQASIRRIRLPRRPG